MNKITIKVSPEATEAYQAASSQERQRIQNIASLLLHKPVDRDVDLLRELMDKISDRARERGLTPEISESILNKH